MQAKFDHLEMVLFDSTIAHFKLTIKGSFTRGRPDNSTSNLIYMNTYTNRQGKTINTLKMNPNIYLIYEFRGDTYDASKQLYSSFPQLFPIREAMSELKDLLQSGEAFIDVEGIIQVNPLHQEPIVIEGIGKDNKWISFGIAAVDESDSQGNIIRKIPGIAIQISDSEYASILTTEEFLTVYSIVTDLDLAGIQTQLASLFYLSSELGSTGGAPAYQAPANKQYRQPQYSNNNQQLQQPYNGNQGAQPYNNGNQGQGGDQSQAYTPRPTSKPTYNNQPQTTRSSYKPRVAPVVRQQPEVTPGQFVDPQPQTTQGNTVQQPTTRGNLPPRNIEKNIVNMKNVEETPVAKFDFNDPDAVNSIFDDEK